MTKAEKEWLDAITRLGCVCCYLQGRYAVPAEPHHLLSGGRRIGHLASIPLCQPHHRAGRRDTQFVSRHPWKVEFEKRYGKESELLAKTRELVREREAMTV